MKPLIRTYKGTEPKIADDVFVAENAVIIGDVEIGAQSSIWYGCVLRGDVEKIRIGERSNIQDGTIVHVTADKFGTYIGDDVLVGHNAVIHGCTLEDGAFVGMGAIVLDGAVVESGAMVAAGALVTPGKIVKSGELWGGNPAKKMRDLTDEQIIGLKHGTDHYVDVAAQYMSEEKS
ncbi:gamma carbonic anhydrase family protein [Terasakiella sp. SH-1]|uniref:gamma carbonic anhydrase family protein n=1 Tax=Terasakiella sp. SH-1 TaxID=2560057 RepID=UPI00107437BB|nr:gamma carbonic anhydrase family protein [Terasakiella sp. SH-1]